MKNFATTVELATPSPEVHEHSVRVFNAALRTFSRGVNSPLWTPPQTSRPTAIFEAAAAPECTPSTLLTAVPRPSPEQRHAVRCASYEVQIVGRNLNACIFASSLNGRGEPGTMNTLDWEDTAAVVVLRALSAVHAPQIHAGLPSLSAW